MNDMRRPKAPNSRAPDTVCAESMARMSETLVTQAASLDAMFTELVEYSAANFKAWPGPTHRYMQLALRAQSNYRASVEAFARVDRNRASGDGK